MKSFLLVLSIVVFTFSSVGQASDKKMEIKHLTDNFYIFTTYHTYKDILFPSNGMYLVTDEGVVLFDTPWDTTQFQPLLDSIKFKHKSDVVMCIATHSHEDRTAGLDYYKQLGIKTFTTKQTDDLCQIHNEPRAQYVIEKDTTFTYGKYSFQTFYAGQGHTPDNIVIWFEKEKILYGGCLIKSTDATDLGNLADANVNEWSTTLRNIKNKFKNPKFIIPGHQSWKSKKSLDHTAKLVRKHLRKKKV